MKYIVLLNYLPFVYEEINTAANFAEIAKAHAVNDTAVKVEALTEEEYEEWVEANERYKL